MKNARAILLVLIAVGQFLVGEAWGQDKAYREGSVWDVSLIKVKPGMFNQYMRDLAASRKPLMEEARKQGLIVSERMLTGESANGGDFNLILMVEYKNWAAFDGLSDKFDALSSKVVGSEDKQVQLMVKRSDMREILGSKTMQEITFK
jgi:hypothetical protein